MFLLISDYLKTETRENSERVHTYISSECLFKHVDSKINYKNFLL